MDFRGYLARQAVEKPAIVSELRGRLAALLERTRPAPRRAPAELPFATIETPSGLRHAKHQTLSFAHRTGRVSIAGARRADARLLSLLAMDPALEGFDPARALYLDTETTGLAGGTGTVAFLVGLGAFTNDGFAVEQLFVRALGEETPMLERVCERIADASCIVTFNGKSFDMPLLRTRCVMSRLPPPPDRPHLDLLHIARRVHKLRGRACRLIGIEEHVLGFVREDDCPSGEVGERYLHFLRSGNTDALFSVIEHNAWDVVAMAALVALYGEPLEETTLDGLDLVGVSRTLRRVKARTEAMQAAELALTRNAGPESVRAIAEAAKAMGDRDRALLSYREIDCPRARLELAKLQEHHAKDPAAALATLELGIAEKEGDLARRVLRLKRKAFQR